MDAQAGSPLEDDESLGLRFGSVASLYDETRPPYPEELWARLASATGSPGGSLAGRLVLDLAAGTGLATRSLIDHGATVIACEPDARQLAQLVRRTPLAWAVRGTAEHLPIRDHRIDLVTCATAWHWFDADVAAAQVARVLRPGGHLALWWANNRHGDGIDWEEAQSAVYDRWPTPVGRPPPESYLGVKPDEAAAHLADRGWQIVVDTTLEWTRRVTREQHVAMLSTHSVVLWLGPDKERFLAEVTAALEPWPELTERLFGAFIVATPPAKAGVAEAGPGG